MISAATSIKLAHIIELRTRINLVRASYGLTPRVFTDTPLVARQTTITGTHVLELRDALIETCGAAMRTPPAFAEPIDSRPTTIRAIHIREVRDAVVALE